MNQSPVKKTPNQARDNLKKVKKDKKPTELKDLGELHPQCISKIKAFQQYYEIDIVENYKDIIELNFLCWELTNPAVDDTDKQKFFIEDFIILKGVKYYKWNIACAVFLQEYLNKYFENNQFMLMLGITYALVNSRDREKMGFFISLTKEEMIDELKKFSMGIYLSQDELAELFKKLLPQQKDVIEDLQAEKTNKMDNNNDFMPIVCRLIAEFGKDANYWVWEVSGDLAISHIETWNKWKMEEYMAQMEASGKQNFSDPNSPESICLANIVKKCEAMERRLKKKST